MWLLIQLMFLFQMTLHLPLLPFFWHFTAKRVSEYLLCEGEKSWLQCRQFEMIRITDVFWGREPHDYETCSKPLPGLTIDRYCETVSIHRYIVSLKIWVLYMTFSPALSIRQTPHTFVFFDPCSTYAMLLAPLGIMGHSPCSLITANGGSKKSTKPIT